MKAHAADSLVDTIGVNRHGSYIDRAYKEFDKERAAFKTLGIRHARDGLLPWTSANRDTYYYQNVRALADLGVRFTMLITKAFGGNPETNMGTLKQHLEWCGNAVIALEGLNEPGDSELADARRLQQALYQTVLAAKLGIPVLAPSIISNNAGLGNVGAWCDYGNMHSYAGSGKPSGPLDNDVRTKSVCWPGKPIQVTECGYHDLASKATGHRGVSEATAGVYAPIVFLEGFRREFKRLFWYELVDELPDPEGKEYEFHFGLFRNDWTLKPAGLAVQRLIALHTDPGKSFTPKDLELSIKGPDTTRSLLFQKADGTYLLDLWRDVEVGARAAQVTVKLPKAVPFYKVHMFDRESFSVNPPQEVGRQVIDITTTLDKTTLEPLYAKRSERTEVVGTGGSDTITVPLGAAVTVLEFAA